MARPQVTQQVQSFKASSARAWPFHPRTEPTRHWYLLVTGVWPFYYTGSPECDPPVDLSEVGDVVEERDSDEGDGGGDGEGPDEAQQETERAGQPDHDLHHRRHHDAALDLRGREK